jgi:hypothetical protein
MRSRFVTVRDTETAMKCLVLELEEVDGAFLNDSRIKSGLRIVLRFEGRQVTCISGYELRDAKGGTVAQLTQAMGTDGTITSFKEMLHYIEDIRHLPSEIDVEAWREQYADLVASNFVGEAFQDAISELPSESLRKVAYLPRGHRQSHIALLDIDAREIVVDLASTNDFGYLVARYLWLPVKAATAEELALFSISPFPYSLIV